MQRNADNAIFVDGRVFEFKKVRKGLYSFFIENSSSYFCFWLNNNEIEMYDYSPVRVLVSESDTPGTFFVRDLKELQDNFLIDRSRFIEIGVHTKLSNARSIIDIDFLFQSLAKNKYTTVGITDGDNVHNFPYVMQLAKKFNINTILGCEIRVFDDELDVFGMCKSISDYSLSQCTFYVIDIETNGLSFEHADILEIAWCKLSSSKGVVDDFSSLVNTKQTLKRFTTDLTGISNEMLNSKGRPIKEILEKIVQLFSNPTNVLVSQTRFDLKFLQFAIKRVLNTDFSPSFIDSKEIFRLVFSEKSRFSVGYLAKEFNVELERAHRALYDARTTAYLVNIALERLGWDKSIGSCSLLRIPFNKSSSSLCTVIAKNSIGIKAMYNLLSEAHTNFFYKYPHVPKSSLEKCRDSIFVLAPTSNDGELYERYFFDTRDLDDIMLSYDYIQMLPNNIVSSSLNDEEADVMIKAFYNYLLSKYSDRIIVSSSPKYLFPNDEKTLEILRYSFNSSDRRVKKYEYFRTFSQMHQEFAAYPSNIREKIISLNMSKMISEIDFNYQITDCYYALGIENAKEKFNNLVFKKLREKYGLNIPSLMMERVEKEIKKINDNNFADIYLLLSEIMLEIKVRFNTIIGSRGSIGSSFVAFLLDITEVNALQAHSFCSKCSQIKFMEEKSGFDIAQSLCTSCGSKLLVDGQNILFETFSGFDGKKIPDADFNIPTYLHSEVLAFVIAFLNKKGFEVVRSSMFSVLKNKNSFFYVRKYFEDKNLPFDKQIMELHSKKVIGCKLAVSQHPGGIIIFPLSKEVSDYCPIQLSARENSDIKETVTHFEHGFLQNQLFKMDLLAHDDPTTLSALFNATGVTVNDIDMADKNILSLFNSSDILKLTLPIINEEIDVGTVGLPEFGTILVRKILKRCNPTNFSHIVRVSGLSHGTNVWKNNADKLIYEEGYSIDQVISVRDDIFDFLKRCNMDYYKAFEIMEFVRKGKIFSDNEKWNNYEAEMRKNNIPEWFIESCSKIIYLYPRAHAVAYVMMAFRIAYFKVYFPLHFYCSFLNRKIEFIDAEILQLSNEEIVTKINEMTPLPLDNKEKNILQLHEVIYEIRSRGFDIGKIDIAKSLAVSFTFDNEERVIIPPLSCIKGLGEQAANKIEEARKEGLFVNMLNFRKRTKIQDSKIKLLQKNGAIKLKDVFQHTLF